MTSIYQEHANSYYRIVKREGAIEENLTRFRHVLLKSNYSQGPCGIAYAVQSLYHIERSPVIPRGLDYGCGAGVFVAEIYRIQGWDVCGIDSDGPLIEVARQKFPEIANRLFVGDVLYSPLPFISENFNFVFCNSVIQHFDETELEYALHDINRVLKHSGIFILTFKEKMSEASAAGCDRTILSMPSSRCNEYSIQASSLGRIEKRLLRLFTLEEVLSLTGKAGLFPAFDTVSMELFPLFRYITKDGFLQTTIIMKKF